MENQDQGMSQVTKLLLAFGGVMAVGFIIVGTTRESPAEKQMEATYMHSSMLTKQATEKCSNAIYAKLQERVYTPSATTGGQNYVQLSWRGTGAVIKEAECRYEQENGITSLTVNGQTLNTKDIADTSAGSSNRSSSAAGGGHGSSSNPGAH